MGHSSLLARLFAGICPSVSQGWKSVRTGSGIISVVLYGRHELTECDQEGVCRRLVQTYRGLW